MCDVEPLPLLPKNGKTSLSLDEKPSSSVILEVENTTSSLTLPEMSVGTIRSEGESNDSPLQKESDPLKSEIVTPVLKSDAETTAPQKDEGTTPSLQLENSVSQSEEEGDPLQSEIVTSVLKSDAETTAPQPDEGTTPSLILENSVSQSEQESFALPVEMEIALSQLESESSPIKSEIEDTSLESEIESPNHLPADIEHQHSSSLESESSSILAEELKPSSEVTLDDSNINSSVEEQRLNTSCPEYLLSPSIPKNSSHSSQNCEQNGEKGADASSDEEKDDLKNNLSSFTNVSFDNQNHRWSVGTREPLVLPAEVPNDSMVDNPSSKKEDDVKPEKKSVEETSVTTIKPENHDVNLIKKPVEESSEMKIIPVTDAGKFAKEEKVKTRNFKVELVKEEETKARDEKDIVNENNSELNNDTQKAPESQKVEVPVAVNREKIICKGNTIFKVTPSEDIISNLPKKPVNDSNSENNNTPEVPATKEDAESPDKTKDFNVSNGKIDIAQEVPVAQQETKSLNEIKDMNGLSHEKGDVQEVPDIKVENESSCPTKVENIICTGNIIFRVSPSEDDNATTTSSEPLNDSNVKPIEATNDTSIKSSSNDLSSTSPTNETLSSTSPTNESLLVPTKNIRRGSKSVAFREPEVEEIIKINRVDVEDDVANGYDTIDGHENDQSSTSPSNCVNGSTENTGDKGETSINGGTGGKRFYRSLGESNPIYRLSMKLSPSLHSTQEIPGANQHRGDTIEKVGYLTKLSGRSFPYIQQWKRRYCVLTKGRLYYYEKEDSKGADKSSGVINLEYFDQVTEAPPKDCKKATNVFIITSQDRSFFDPGRHLFSAESLPEMKEWVKKLQFALDQIRNNNRSATSTTSRKEGGKKSGGEFAEKGVGRREETQDNNKENRETRENRENATNSTKDRKKKKDPHRPRKSARVGDGCEQPSSQGQNIDSSTTYGTTSHREVSGPPKSVSSVGVQLPGMTTTPTGVKLAGMSSKKKDYTEESSSKEMARSSSDGANIMHPQEEESPVNDEGDILLTTGPPLTSITKLRAKGPPGRRAPQNRRTLAASTLKQQRASSLSALEYQDLNDNSEVPWLNRSLDMLDESPPLNRRAPNLPYKAYNYSTDEEMDAEDEISQSDSIPTSAADMPPPPPPRSASYGLEHRHNQRHGHGDRQVLHRSLGEVRESSGELRGSKRSLSDVRVYGLVGEWRRSSADHWPGSHHSLQQDGDLLGSASPVMDDLDNLLMNQSVQHTSMAMDSGSESDSEGSTCKPIVKQKQQQQQQQQQQHQHKQANHQSTKKSSKHNKQCDPSLNRFAIAVKHLQRHVVEIDRAVCNITGDVSGTREEVTTLREAVLALQSDTDTITRTLSHLTEEAISAQQQITYAAQEAEKVRKITNMALQEAEQAKQEQIKAKKDFEYLIEEMRLSLKSFRESQVSNSNTGDIVKMIVTSKDKFSSRLNQERQAFKNSVSKMSDDSKHAAMEFRPIEENLRSSSPKPGTRTSSISIGSSTSSSRLSGTPAPEPLSTPVSKSSSFSHTPKIPPYQSLFSRPSSFMSGLAHRTSLSKSVSFADQKEEEKHQEKENDAPLQKETEEKRSKEEILQTTLERKSKKESKHKEERKPAPYDTNSKERKHKEKKESGSIDRRERKHRHGNKEKKSYLKNRKEEEHMISNLSLEDIPMADDNANEISNKQTEMSKVCSHSHSTQTPSNFSLGKSASTPAVPHNKPTSRPQALPLNKEYHKLELSNSNASTPDSPVPTCACPHSYTPSNRPTSPNFRSSSGFLPTVNENQCMVETSSLTSLHRPGSTPGAIVRQSSMTTVPENQEIHAVTKVANRPGKFAISRQSSTPNIPLQRQNSGTLIPLQRQHSYGVVPEDGRLLRQDSLMSVPENRPITDQTLPLSPSASMTYFPISPSPSISNVPEPITRRTFRTSMEVVTGPIISGSSMQEASATGTLPVLMSLDEIAEPTATSSLKKEKKVKKDLDGVVI